MSRRNRDKQKSPDDGNERKEFWRLGFFHPCGHALAPPAPFTLERLAAGRAADLDDAAGRPLSAGISRIARQGRRLPRSVLHAGIRRRGHAAADPPLQLRCRDHLLGHPRHPRRARPRRAVRGRRRPAARSAGYARGRRAGASSPTSQNSNRCSRRCAASAASSIETSR
jgi:hypothetical protein